MSHVGLNHVVQFYESESFLCDAVGDFLHAGAEARQPLVVFATPHRWSGFSTRLRARGSNVDACREQGLLTVLDARDTLSAFMVDDMPDERRFMDHVGGLIEQRTRLSSSGTVRAYGEMVDLLWQDGNPDAAIRLEALWNDLASVHDLSLLCAYAMSNFHGERDQRRFLEICSQHARVSPADPYGGAIDDASRGREVSSLQQRARALEIEVEYRKRLEAALRKALAERAQFEEALLSREQDLRNLLGEREQLLSSERAAREQAEQASRLKDEFLAIISHELRTPLHAIFGWAHIGSEPRADDAIRQRAFEVIQRNARLQLRVVDDLLDISRIISGKMKISTDVVDLAGVVTAAADSVRPLALAKPLQFDVVLAVDRIDVRGDAGRLQQVIWNLLSNAIKFTPKGGRVQVVLGRVESHVEIGIQDSGIGISSEFLPHVFEPFQQEKEGSKRRHGGLGLGLSIVKHIVELHGGEILAASEGEGKGTTFTVKLPLLGTGEALGLAPRHPKSGDGLASVLLGRLEKVKVLLVDDEPNANEAVQALLDSCGAEVRVAGSAAQALQVLDVWRPDVLISDIAMPEEDGYVLIKKIRARSARKSGDIPAAALTAYAKIEDRVSILAAGFQMYLSKPADPSELIAVVASLASSRRRSLDIVPKVSGSPDD